MKNILESARDDLIELIVDNAEGIDVDNEIWQIADNSVPVYNYDIMQAANNDYDLILVRPRLASGEETPLNLIMLNIFESIESHLWEFWHDAEDYVNEYVDKVNDLSDMESDEMKEILMDDYQLPEEDFDLGIDEESDEMEDVLKEWLEEFYLEDLKSELESC